MTGRIFVLIGLALAVGHTVQKVQAQDTALYAGEQLTFPDELVSPNGFAKLTGVQTNPFGGTEAWLGIYWDEDHNGIFTVSPQNELVWRWLDPASCVSGSNYVVEKQGGYLRMQEDGNLVLRRANNTVVCASGTNGSSGAWMNLQNDGNLVVYSSSNVPLWSVF